MYISKKNVLCTFYMILKKDINNITFTMYICYGHSETYIQKTPKCTFEMYVHMVLNYMYLTMYVLHVPSEMTFSISLINEHKNCTLQHEVSNVHLKCTLCKKILEYRKCALKM